MMSGINVRMNGNNKTTVQAIVKTTVLGTQILRVMLDLEVMLQQVENKYINEATKIIINTYIMDGQVNQELENLKIKKT